MIVYIESNFLLEVALGQKDASSADAILTLAEGDKIKLVFPGFALSESFASVMHVNSERFRLRNSLEAMLKQLKQSGQLEPHWKLQRCPELHPTFCLMQQYLYF